MTMLSADGYLARHAWSTTSTNPALVTIAEIGKGESNVRVARLAEEELVPQLPFRFVVRDVGLFEVGPDGWHELRRFALA